MLRKIFLLISGILLVTNVLAAKEIGTVLAAQGNVYVLAEKGIAKRVLRRKSKIYLKETIVTGKNGQTQLRLMDGTIISLRPMTKYLVSEFVFDKKSTADNRYVGELIEGVLVSLSGKGEEQEMSRSLKTPVITIAIRGTFFEAGFNVKNFVKNGSGPAGAIALGWVQVADGVLNIIANNDPTGFVALFGNDKNANSCVYKAIGLFESGVFKLSNINKINIQLMSRAEMQNLVVRSLDVLQRMNFFDKNFYQVILQTNIPVPGVDNALNRAKELLKGFVWPEGVLNGGFVWPGL